MRLDQLAQIGETITEHWPSYLGCAIVKGQLIADVACGLLDELHERQQRRGKRFNVENMEIKDFVSRDHKQSRANTVRKIILKRIDQFTIKDIMLDCPPLVMRSDIGSMISNLVTKGKLKRIKHGVHECMR